VRPTAHSLFLRRQEKEAKEGEPDSSPLRCATGTLRCSGQAGCA